MPKNTIYIRDKYDRINVISSGNGRQPGFMLIVKITQVCQSGIRRKWHLPVDHNEPKTTKISWLAIRHMALYILTR